MWGWVPRDAAARSLPPPAPRCRSGSPRSSSSPLLGTARSGPRTSDLEPSPLCSGTASVLWAFPHCNSELCSGCLVLTWAFL